MNLYERIDCLCNQNGINITEMCKKSGAPRGALTDLKKGRIKSLSAGTLEKIANYFDVSLDCLLGKEETKKSPSVSEEDIKIALFNGDKDVSDEAWEEVKRFAAYAKEKYGKRYGE